MDYFYIPENLDLEQLLIDNDHAYLIKHIDKFYYIISTICFYVLYNKKYFKAYIALKNSTNKKILDKIKGGYIPLSAKYLENICTKRFYGIIRKILINLKIIECNESYVPGVFSKGYRLCPKYRFSYLKKIYIKDLRLEKKLNKIRAAKRFNLLDIEKKLYDNLMNLEIEYEMALKIINERKFAGEFESERAYDTRICSVENLYNKKIIFAKDDKTGRIFTNVTFMGKELRKFLIFDQNRLCEIDIANSQPFFLNFILLDYYEKQEINKRTNLYSNISYLNNINYYNNTTLSNNYHNINYNTPYVPSFYSLPKDVCHYYELTLSGTFYEEIQIMWGEELGKELDKDKIKKMTLTMFFGFNHWKSKELDIFMEYFPNVWSVIKHEKKNNYKNLALKLQKAEAEFIINTVVKRIINEEPDLPLYTIHDSILTLPEYAKYIENIIAEESKQKFGASPKTRCIDYNN